MRPSPRLRRSIAAFALAWAGLCGANPAIEPLPVEEITPGDFIGLAPGKQGANRSRPTCAGQCRRSLWAPMWQSTGAPP